MNNAPLVGIIMGSDSDLPVMQDAARILEELQVSSEIAIVSAHRTPERLVEYAKTAESRGIKVVIAGAGGAAHLPGMCASFTALPVVGVPIMGSAGKAAGLDALFSIVQMPPGVPVATVAINGGKNAGILAAQIIGASDETVRARVRLYKEHMRKDIEVKDQELQEKGFATYLKEKGLL
jgi:5-(carboxyamino)imidazole ribonucleotide mutase